MYEELLPETHDTLVNSDKVLVTKEEEQQTTTTQWVTETEETRITVTLQLFNYCKLTHLWVRINLSRR